MNAASITFGLREIQKTFAPILEDDAEWIIQNAVKEVETSKANFDERQRQTHDPRLDPEPWGYRIYPEHPLRFKPQAIKGLILWADVYCLVLWREEGAPPVKQNLVLRVWSSLENECTYRKEWDSRRVLEELTSGSRSEDGRVMLRYHFDLADPSQQALEYHVQAGGNPRTNELCWFPEAIDLPRLPFPPMDLVLLSQLIATNFYWDDYVDFRETAEWISALRRSQEHLLQGYYEGCLNALDQDLLVDHLWNLPDGND